MSFWKHIFGGKPTTTGQPTTDPVAAKPSKREPVRGEIKYVLLVTSLPEEPSMPHMCSFIQDTLPELKNGDAKIGLVWKTDPIDSINVPALAVEAFGSHVGDESQFSYRTIGVKLQQGHAKILVIYEKA